MLALLGHFILSHTQWLYVRLYEGPLGFFDLWSLNHLCSGCLVWLAARALGLRHPGRWLGAALVGYELLELAFIYAAFHAFYPETLTDQLTDLAVGCAGAALAELGLRHLRGASAEWATQTVAALSLSFLWVGGYGYTYSVPVLNSPGVNWWAWTCWTLGLLVTLRGQDAVRARLRGARAWAVSYGLYLAALLAVEATGYFALHIREVGHADRQPLVGELVHGTASMHAAYLLAPVIVWAAHLGLRALFQRAARRSRPQRDEALVPRPAALGLATVRVSIARDRASRR